MLQLIKQKNLPSNRFKSLCDYKFHYKFIKMKNFFYYVNSGMKKIPIKLFKNFETCLNKMEIFVTINQHFCLLEWKKCSIKFTFFIVRSSTFFSSSLCVNKPKITAKILDENFFIFSSTSVDSSLISSYLLRHKWCLTSIYICLCQVFIFFFLYNVIKNFFLCSLNKRKANKK